MKKANKAIISLLAGVCFSMASCVDSFKVGDGFLEKAPGGTDINIDSVFGKAEYTRNFLWTIYNKINYPFTFSVGLNGSPIEILSDVLHSHCGWSWGNEYWYPGLVTEDAQNNGQNKDKFLFQTSTRGAGRVQESIWAAIRRAWLFIENIERVPDMSDTEKSRLKGEAYTIMATRYLDGYKNFGGLPILDHAYGTGEDFTRGRSTTLRTAYFIDSIINCAIKEKDFPFALSDQNTEAGRLTKGAAYALRAKLWAFAASPLFNDAQPYMPESSFRQDEVVDYVEGMNGANATKIEAVWHGGYHKELWDSCVNACKKFFEVNAGHGNPFAMIQPTGNTVNDYRKAFREAYFGQGNSEKLIEVHPFGSNDYNAPWEWEWPSQAVAALIEESHMGHTNPTLELMEMFPMANGKNYNYQNLYGTENPENIDIFVDRDPRLYESMVVPMQTLYEDYQGEQNFQTWMGGQPQNVSNNLFASQPDRWRTGFALYKFIFDYHKLANQLLCYSYMRMADLHLIYAEALAQTGNSQGACDELNKVRARVGLPKIETSNPELNLITNKENLIKEIMRERACELFLEDERLYDIIRYKMEDKFTTPLHELRIYRKNADGSRNTESNTMLAEGEAWPKFRYDREEIQIGHRAWWDKGFWTNKWYLSPLPRTEINKGYGLFQNPGW